MVLGPDELAYAAKSRATNTLKGYRSDFAEWTSWCAAHGIEPMPAEPVAVAKYLSNLARHGAKVGTMSRRLSSIRFVEHAAGHTSQLDDAIVSTVWEGIRRTHGAPPEQSLPIMPPLLWAILEATPTTLDNGEKSLGGLRVTSCCSSGSSARSAAPRWVASMSSTSKLTTRDSCST